MLNKHYGHGENKRFKDYESLRNEAKRLYNEIVKKEGGKLTLTRIRKDLGYAKKGNKSKVKKSNIPLPFIIPEFKKVFAYFECTDSSGRDEALGVIAGLGNTTRIISPKIWGKDVSFIGGKQYSYYDTFKPFVDWCNKKLGRHSSSMTFHVKFEIDNMQPVDGKWQIELITCTKDGVPTDFGYDPKAPEQGEPTKAAQEIIDQSSEDAEKPEVKKPVPPTPETPKTDTLEQAKVEEFKKGESQKRELSKKREELENLYAARKAETAQLREYKELGIDDLAKDSITEIKRLSDKIKKLT